MELSESVIEIICKNLKLSYEDLMEMDEETLCKHVEKITGKRVVVNSKGFKYPKEDTPVGSEMQC